MHFKSGHLYNLVVLWIGAAPYILTETISDCGTKENKRSFIFRLWFLQIANNKWRPLVSATLPLTNRGFLLPKKCFYWTQLSHKWESLRVPTFPAWCWSRLQVRIYKLWTGLYYHGKVVSKLLIFAVPSS